MSWCAFCRCHQFIVDNQQAIIVAFNKLFHNNGSASGTFFGMTKSFQGFLIVLNIDRNPSAVVSIYWFDNQREPYISTSFFQTAFTTDNITFWHFYFSLFQQIFGIFFITCQFHTNATSFTCNRGLDAFLVGAITQLAQGVFI